MVDRVARKMAEVGFDCRLIDFKFAFCIHHFVCVWDTSATGIQVGVRVQPVGSFLSPCGP